MPATKHTDPHKLPHCGLHNLNFDNDIEFLEHLENEKHEVTGFFKCGRCKKENIPFKAFIKQDPTEPHIVDLCDDCVAEKAKEKTS